MKHQCAFDSAQATLVLVLDLLMLEVAAVLKTLFSLLQVSGFIYQNIKNV